LSKLKSDKLGDTVPHQTPNNAHHDALQARGREREARHEAGEELTYGPKVVEQHVNSGCYNASVNHATRLNSGSAPPDSSKLKPRPSIKAVEEVQ